MKPSVALMLLVTLSATGCDKNGPAPAPSPGEFCRIARPIYFDPADRMTRATELAIIRHNEQGASICGWAGAQ